MRLPICLIQFSLSTKNCVMIGIMNRIGKTRTFLVVAVLLVMSSIGNAQQSYEQTQRSKLFNALDTFGFPEFASGQFIKITTITTDEKQQNPLTNCFFGFLIKSEPTGFTARLFDLSVFRFEVAHNPRYPRLQKATYESADFAAWAKDVMPSTIIPSLSCVPIPELAASRACAARRLPELSNTMFNQIKYAEDVGTVQDHFDNAWESLRFAALDQAMSDIANPRIARSQPLQSLIALNKSYEENPGPARFTLGVDSGEFRIEAVSILQRMVTDDEAHLRVQSEPAKVSSLETRIANLIFELRDETINPTVSPRFEVNLNDRKLSNGASERLIKIGSPAIPQLLAALEDTSFTRNIFRDAVLTNMFYSFHSDLVRVQDMAISILEQISHQQIDDYPAPYPYNGKLPASVINRAKAWWAIHNTNQGGVNVRRAKTDSRLR